MRQKENQWLGQGHRAGSDRARTRTSMIILNAHWLLLAWCMSQLSPCSSLPPLSPALTAWKHYLLFNTYSGSLGQGTWGVQALKNTFWGAYTISLENGPLWCIVIYWWIFRIMNISQCENSCFLRYSWMTVTPNQHVSTILEVQCHAVLWKK